MLGTSKKNKSFESPHNEGLLTITPAIVPARLPIIPLNILPGTA
jgi:hypothetical protein